MGQGSEHFLRSDSCETRSSEERFDRFTKRCCNEFGSGAVQMNAVQGEMKTTLGCDGVDSIERAQEKGIPGHDGEAAGQVP